MRNKLKTLFVLLAAIMCFVFAIACDEKPKDPPPHEHTYAETLSHDATHHWYAATCEHTEEVKDKAEHTLTETTITASTWTVKGSAKKVCSCGYETAPYELALLGKLTPEYTAPTNLTATVEDTLASVTLPAGFSWQLENGTPETTVLGTAGEKDFKLTYTAPNDTESKFNKVEDIAVKVAVAKKQIAIPSEDADAPFTFSGELQEYEIASSDYYTVLGAKETNVGDYTARVILNDTENYEWADGTITALEYDYEITPLNVETLAEVSVADIVEGETPEVTVTLDEFIIDPETDFEIVIGDATVVNPSVSATVTFSGNFTGTIVETFAVKSIAENIAALVDFNYDLGERENGKTVEMYGTEINENYSTVFDGTGALNVVSGKKSIAKVNGVSFGTNDFTVAMDVKLDAAGYASGTINEYNALIESSEHIAYSCKGNNYNSQCAICNGTAVSTEENDLFQASIIYESSTYKVRVALPGANMKYAFSTSEAESLITPNNNWFNIALTVDRGFEVSGTTDTTKVTLYINGVEKTSKNFTLTTTQVLGGDEIYLGGAMTQSNGVTYRNRTIDSFVAYNGLLNETQISANLPRYISSVATKSDWKAPETVAFDFTDLTEGAYSTVVTLTGTATLTGATLKNADSGITLTPVDGQAGKYTLAFATTALEAVNGGADLTISLNGYDKTFRVVYTPLEAIYASGNVSFYDFEISNSGVSKSFKISADQAGTVGLNGVTFSVGGSAYDKITADANAGEYTLTLTKDEAEAITEAITVTATYEDLTDTFTISRVSMLVCDNGSYTANNNDTSSYVVYDKQLGTDSWTIGFNYTVPTALGSNKTYDIFSTTGRDCTQGITFSSKNEGSTNGWTGRIKLCGTTLWFKGISLGNYAGQTISVVLVIDRTVDGEIAVSIYYNGQKNNPTSGGNKVSVASTVALDYLTSNDNTHTPVAQLAFGGQNPSIRGKIDSSDTTHDGGLLFSKAENISMGFTNIYIVKGIHNETLTAALMAKLPA